MSMYSLKDSLLELENKDFIHRCLKILNDAERFSDIELLTNPSICKDRFDMNFAILKNVPSIGSIDRGEFMDDAGYRRYYSKPIILRNDEQYIICNDWYFNTKANTRDTRTKFVKWVLI